MTQFATKFQEVLASFKGRISGGSEYGWSCYSPNARMVVFGGDTATAFKDSVEIQVIFDTQTQDVFELMFFERNQAWRWVHPRYRDAFLEECQKRKFNPATYLDDGFTRDIASWGEVLLMAEKLFSKYHP